MGEPDERLAAVCEEGLGRVVECGFSRGAVLKAMPSSGDRVLRCAVVSASLVISTGWHAEGCNEVVELGLVVFSRQNAVKQWGVRGPVGRYARLRTKPRKQ